MYKQLKNNDLVITNNKMGILNYLNENKIFLNLRLMTLKEFKDKYFGYYDEEAIYYLVNKYGYKYDVAKMYLDNFLFNDSLKEELLENNLIIKEPLFIKSIKRIVVDTEVDSYVQNEIDKYENINIKSSKGKYIHPVYEFETVEEEVNFVCVSILKLLDKVDINRIKLVNVTSEYEMTLLRLFGFYNIPINLKLDKNIYATNSVQSFLSNLKITKNIEESLCDINKDDIYNKIIDVCNLYRFKEVDDTIIYLIEETLKRSTIKSKMIDNAVNIVSIDDINDKDYYFILGFNQGSIPKVYKDEDYFSDSVKKKFGILTSLEKNINNFIFFINIFF